MALTREQIQRIDEIAFHHNRSLPEAYQAELFEEGVCSYGRLSDRGLIDRKILIVGGAGYVGLPLTAFLLSHGYRIRCLDLLLYENHECVLPHMMNPNYEFMHGDFAEGQVLEDALKGVTDVVLLAGLVGDPITKKYPNESQKINHDGYMRLIEQLNGRGLNRVIFASTCSNYGLIPDDRMADENYELKPLSLYAKAKVAVEKRLLKFKGEVDYQPAILRFSTAFGLSPRMRFDLTVSQFAREIFLKRELVVFDAHTWRPYCHIQDFASLVCRVLEAPASRVSFEVFNAGGDINNYTKQMIVDEIIKHFPKSPVTFQEHGSDPRNYKVDFSKIRKTLYFEPKFTVKDGIDELTCALEQNIFANVDKRPNFFSNNKISYP